MIEFIIGTLVGVLLGGFIVFKMYDHSFHEMIKENFEEQLNKE
jgi:uncharacterized membrane protein YccC